MLQQWLPAGVEIFCTHAHAKTKAVCIAMPVILAYISLIYGRQCKLAMVGERQIHFGMM